MIGRFIVPAALAAEFIPPQPVRLPEEPQLCRRVIAAIERQGVGYTEVRNVALLNQHAEDVLLPILERHFEISKPHPQFHKWELRRKTSNSFSRRLPYRRPGSRSVANARQNQTTQDGCQTYRLLSDNAGQT